MVGMKDDAEHHHAPLLDVEAEEEEEGRRSRPLKLRGYLVIFASIVFLVSMAALIIYQSHDYYYDDEAKIENIKGNKNNDNYKKVLPRGVAEGVSAKSNSFLSETTPSYNWTNAMLSWQRTAFHFQPERNWMNVWLISVLVVLLAWGCSTTAC